MLESEIFEKYQYKDAIDSASAFNTRLLVERQSRLPFLDTQTNIAQVDCHIWKKKCERVEPVGKGVEYAYQVRYWKKLPKPKKVTPPPPPDIPADPEEAPVVEEMPLSVKPELVAQEESTGLDTPPSAPTPEEQSPSSDDYEMYYERKRKRQSRGASSRRTNNNSKQNTVESVRRGSRSRKGSVISTRSSGRGIKVEEMETVEVVNTPPPREPTPAKDDSATDEGEKKPVIVCDFCLTENNAENKESKAGEITISCVDCNRTAHPSCLQFEGSLAETVKSYKWQCIECKSCSICGTSDNDDQLLFCDECDRGFHMYCLTPRIERPPEGRWVCHMCNKQPTQHAENTPHQTSAASQHAGNAAPQALNLIKPQVTMEQPQVSPLEVTIVPPQVTVVPSQVTVVPPQVTVVPSQMTMVPSQAEISITMSHDGNNTTSQS